MANSLFIAVIFVSLQCIDAKVCTVTLRGYKTTDYCAYGCCYTASSVCCSKPFYLHSWFIVSFVGTAGSILAFIVVVIVTMARKRRLQATQSAAQSVFAAGPQGAPSATAPNGHLASGDLSFISTSSYPVQPVGGDTPMRTAQFIRGLRTPMDPPPAYTDQQAAAPPPFEYGLYGSGEALPSKTALQ